ncbi:KipI antagonist [Bacillus canaveralius]|uniref:KipI antagonist n=1 Tax=Bacillus canaveralius TaxID=1403243 RepID=A0A2N5GII9_9BACI|nr:biotin-dependent carboxyltransferase family protein [Bacillus canaveralius]PLR80796.1 KipI antagonist [Bacillus canaveralius]PLR98326.1 KipI antagonist [Bacillus canaveralius]RSK52952.1 biotin-dependent carboxyltransferase family protein [Bacillus canaveralius]
MGIQVIKPGLQSTIQDLGRFGYQEYGVIVSGAMDNYALRVANLLVGNEEGEAGLEITLIGPSLLFEHNTVISLFGAELHASIDGTPIPNGKPLMAEKGSILSFGSVKNGCRCYLAIKGGFATDPVMSSKSTYMKAKIGGYQGRMIAAGDVLPIKETVLFQQPSWRASPSLSRYITENNPIRFISGKQADWFTNEGKTAFTSSPYLIANDSDRMGYRLKGSPINLMEKKELITEGVTVGSIQVPHDGQPIILMADRQTTGGYPKIGQVASVDLPALAQRKPGESLSFQEISLQVAHRLLFEQEKELQLLKRFINNKLKGV